MRRRSEPRILIVSPVRNEAAHIERVARALAAQELRPERWIVIDDASTDGTRELLESLAAEVPFMQVHDAGPECHMPGRAIGSRGRPRPRNFNGGLARRSTGANTPTS